VYSTVASSLQITVEHIIIPIHTGSDINRLNIQRGIVTGAFFNTNDGRKGTTAVNIIIRLRMFHDTFIEKITQSEQTKSTMLIHRRSGYNQLLCAPVSLHIPYVTAVSSIQTEHGI